MAQDRVEAVERALTLLDAFQEPGEEITLAELSKKTGFYKSTILRLAGSLERFGYLVRNEVGAFRLGPAVWQLGNRYRRVLQMGERIRPMLEALRDRTGETASIYVRDGDARVCLYRANSHHAMRHHLDEGAHFDLRQGAAGKVLCAWTEPDSPDHANIRRQGFAVSLGERDPDIGALAVPLLGRNDEFKGALSLSGVVAHFAESKIGAILPPLQDAAVELNALLAASD